MPELPEVQTICSGLEDNIIGKKISEVKISDKRLRLPFPKHFTSILKDKEILSVSRRARYILVNLSEDNIMLIHLGMSGRLIYQDNLPGNLQKHDHCFIAFSDNSCLTYNDPRRFGLIDLVSKKDLASHKMIKNLGPEPLNDEFNVQYLQGQLKNKKINIKTAMMDNKIVVGVGNIYINESLFNSRISPLRPSQSLKLKELELLLNNIKDILKKAIQAGGSTLRDYVDLKGDVGEFQFDFKVYGRDNDACFDCNGLIKRIKQNGRSSFYCSNCQS